MKRPGRMLRRLPSQSVRTMAAITRATALASTRKTRAKIAAEETEREPFERRNP